MSSQLSATSLSVAGLLTPASPVGDAQDQSDGFGTLAEAGWNERGAVYGASCAPGAALAMAADESSVVLLFQPEAGGAVRFLRGTYEEEGGE